MPPTLIAQPTRITAAGNKPKLIDEYIGRVNSETAGVSVAHMRSPQGWIEPGQTPEFEEFTIVLKGLLRVSYKDGEFDVKAGQAVVTHPGEWVRYSTPDAEPSTSPSAFRHSPWRRCIAMNSPQAQPKAIRFARIVYLAAGIVGLLEIVPLYFYEATFNRTQPPAITHPEFYYGFLGVTLAWQVAFLVIARDPLRFRPLMPVTWIEKLLYPVAVGLLYSAGRIRADMVPVAVLDLLWLSLFVLAWLKTRETAQR